MRRPSPAVRICFATAAQRAHFCDDASAARRREEREERRESDIEGAENSRGRVRRKEARGSFTSTGSITLTGAFPCTCTAPDPADFS
jgi:hypothetical protein